MPALASPLAGLALAGSALVRSAPTARGKRTARTARALARARVRRREAGAVMFIVAVTLGLLAVMGVYGLSATSADIRSAGHMREALQGQKAGEAVFMMTGETFNAKVAAGLVRNMADGVGQARDCVTAKAYTGNVDTSAAEACIRLDPARMVTYANTTNPGAPWAASGAFSAGSFGSVVNQPFVSVEVTNPVDTDVAAGNSQKVRYTQLTVTVLVQMKASAGVAAVTSVAGRGRIIVGPTQIDNNGGGRPAQF